MTTMKKKAEGLPPRPGMDVNPEVWRQQMTTQAVDVTQATAVARAKAAKSLPWQGARKVPPVWAGGKGQRATTSGHQLDDAAQAILGSGKAQIPSENVLKDQPLPRVSPETTHAGDKPKPRPASLFQRKKSAPQTVEAASVPKKTIHRPKPVAAVSSQASAFEEISQGARHVVTGAAEIVCGALHGVSTTGRYTYDGVAAGTRLTLGGAAAAGRYSLLGVRYALSDSTRLARGAVGWLCPQPRTKP